jgi:diguanylate cyclase (GGDEF)-like protein
LDKSLADVAGSRILCRTMSSSPIAPSPPVTAAEPLFRPADPRSPIGRMRRWALTAGQSRFCVVITIVTLVVSLLVTALIGQLAALPDRQFWTSLVIGALVPILVAPPVSWIVVKLLYEAENARRIAERLAITDPLTGVFNRRCFFELAEIEFLRSQRLAMPMAVLLIDIDHFKGVNDRYGHAVGDVVLSQVAQSCAGGLRHYDVLARYGGEEFVALLPSTDLGTATVVAERLRNGVAALRAPLKQPVGGKDTIESTISIGAAALTAPITSFSALLELADQAMYRAKASGRNRTCTTP